MGKKKGRRNNASGSSSHNARAKAQRQRAGYYYEDESLDSDDEYYPRRGNYSSRRDRPPDHDYRGPNCCPLCSLRTTLLVLDIVKEKDQARTDDYLFSLNWGIYGGLAAAILLYYPSQLACDSNAHWIVRWPWILSWHCMTVSCLAGLFLKYYFVKPFMQIVYAPKVPRTFGETINLRYELEVQLERYMIGRMCAGVAVLFILGGALAVAGLITLVLGRFGTLLHTKWMLRRAARLIQHFVHTADRVGRATGKNAMKSAPLLLAFAKLYGRTLVKFSRSLLVFAIDLAQLLLLTAAASSVIAILFLVYALISGPIFGRRLPKATNDTHSAHESPKHAPLPRPSDTPPPLYNPLNGDLPAGNFGKKKNQTRAQKA